MIVKIIIVIIIEDVIITAEIRDKIDHYIF